MRRRVARTVVASAATLGSVGATLVLAAPARACSCDAPDMERALDAGLTLAVVTRTDPGPEDENAGGGLPTATFRVEDWVGPEPPATLTGRMDTGGSCQPYVAPGALAALIFERKDSRWHLGACSGVALGPALQRAQGDPVAVRGGRPVAYVAGAYGRGRVAAVDRDGRVVAWDRTTGHGDLVAACPGGRRVVVAGRTLPSSPSTAKDYEDRSGQLTVHDARTLKVLRTVRLGKPGSGRVLPVRCADAAAARVQVLATGGEEGDAARLLTVRGGRVEGTGAGRASRAETVDGGFVALDGEGGGHPSVVRIRPDGSRTTIATLSDAIGADQLAVSRDGRTVAVSASREVRPSGLVTIDLRTGERLGEWSRKGLHVSGLAWTPAGRLLVRDQVGYHPATTPVYSFDRTLGDRQRWGDVADEWAGRLAAVGEAAVVYGSGSRLTATPRSGSPLVARELRLAAGEHLVAVSDAGFATRGGEPADGERVAVTDEPGTGGAPGLLVAALGGATAAVLLGGAAGILLRRRRDPAPPSV